MKKLINCEFNMDIVCVELKFSDGSMIAIDTVAVENEVADNMYQRSELDYLIYSNTHFSVVRFVHPAILSRDMHRAYAPVHL